MKPEDVTSAMQEAFHRNVHLTSMGSILNLRNAISAAINAMPPDPELERLRVENERLRGALQIIAGECQCVDALMSNADVARAALQEPKP